MSSWSSAIGRLPATLAMMTLAGVIGSVLACSGDRSSGAITGPPAGMPGCTGNALLSRSPVALSALQEIDPLGNLNPPGHVFPSDHIYFYQASGASFTPVVSPGEITITQVGLQTMTTGAATTSDYVIRFFPCADVMLYFYHLAALSPELKAQVGAITGGCNPSYVIGSTTYQQCYKEVSIALSAGAAVGTMGASGAIDLGAIDRRVPSLAYVNPGRTQGATGEFTANKTVCPIDYFTTDAATAMRALLGARNFKRVVAPVCGEVMQDVAGTAQGRWYFDNSDAEGAHLALVHDNADATLGAFSVGTSIASLPVGVYTFRPVLSGRLNADFSRVMADGNVYCYEVTSPSPQRIYVRMPDASTLQIGASPGSSCGAQATWNAALAATTFKR